MFDRFNEEGSKTESFKDGRNGSKHDVEEQRERERERGKIEKAKENLRGKKERRLRRFGGVRERLVGCFPSTFFFFFPF